MCVTLQTTERDGTQFFACFGLHADCNKLNALCYLNAAAPFSMIYNVGIVQRLQRAKRTACPFLTLRLPSALLPFLPHPPPPRRLYLPLKQGFAMLLHHIIALLSATSASSEDGAGVGGTGLTLKLFNNTGFAEAPYRTSVIPAFDFSMAG